MLDGNKLLNAIPETPLSESVSLGANPVSDDLVLHFTSVHEAAVTIQLFDVTGKLVLDKSFRNQAGHQSLRIPVHYLAAGMYIASVSSGNQHLTEKIIKD